MAVTSDENKRSADRSADGTVPGAQRRGAAKSSTSNLYRIRNVKTKEWWEGKAESARAACATAGWVFDDCEIKFKSDYGCGGWKKCREN